MSSLRYLYEFENKKIQKKAKRNKMREKDNEEMLEEKEKNEQSRKTRISERKFFFSRNK